MKKIKIIFFFLFFVLSASTCKKEGKDCHYDLIIQNKSETTVIVAYKFYYDDLCILQGTEVAPGDSYTEHSRICWENRISNKLLQEVYIIDTTKFNAPNVYYSCDSIEHKNKMLKHYVLTLEDLKKSNFTVIYPDGRSTLTVKKEAFGVIFNRWFFQFGFGTGSTLY